MEILTLLVQNLVVDLHPSQVAVTLDNKNIQTVSAIPRTAACRVGAHLSPSKTVASYSGPYLAPLTKKFQIMFHLFAPPFWF